ncbi:MAG: hypothetical protein M1834_007780 [Cirrosporium novae-zelandiae]|nr:MAG: hypothetical protein M1834_007780 [Cirrosporium novae-zelandiae]
MASRSSLRLMTSFRLPLPSYRPCLRCLYSTVADAPPASPLLQKLKSDLKAALKAKDKNRLNVLRAVLAETTNLNKTSNPISSDLDLLLVLRKKVKASKTACEEFAAANRDDLKDKEQAQIAVLEEYAGQVDVMAPEQLREIVVKKIEEMKIGNDKVNKNAAIKALLGPSGEFQGKDIYKGDVVRIVNEVLGK